MDVAQQRDIDIDRPSAQQWPPMPRWQNLRGVFDNESMTQLLGIRWRIYWICTCQTPTVKQGVSFWP